MTLPDHEAFISSVRRNAEALRTVFQSNQTREPKRMEAAIAMLNEAVAVAIEERRVQK